MSTWCNRSFPKLANNLLKYSRWKVRSLVRLVVLRKTIHCRWYNDSLHKLLRIDISEIKRYGKFRGYAHNGQHVNIFWFSAMGQHNRWLLCWTVANRQIIALKEQMVSSNLAIWQDKCDKIKYFCPNSWQTEMACQIILRCQNYHLTAFQEQIKNLGFIRLLNNHYVLAWPIVISRVRGPSLPHEDNMFCYYILSVSSPAHLPGRSLPKVKIYQDIFSDLSLVPSDMTLEMAWRTRPLQLVLGGGPVTNTPIREYNGLRGENRSPF